MPLRPGHDAGGAGSRTPRSGSIRMSDRVSQRLAVLGLTLPPPPRPRGDYVGVVVHAGIAYVSGQVSREGQSVIAGPAGFDTSAETMAKAAQSCVLRALSALELPIGGLDTISRVLFLRGFVNARSDFQDHSKVLDPASRLLLAIFDDRGAHARSAVGVASLPSGGLLEIELTVALADRHRPP